MALRGARALLPLLLVATTVVAGAPRALAQEPPSVSLELLSQTSWISPPDVRFGVRVLARNEGSEPIRDLDVRLVLGPAFTSRFDYEASLLTGPSTIVHTARQRVGGAIQPGGVRELSIAVDPGTISALSPTDSRVHPLRVEVRTRGRTLGTLNTSLVWIVREPERPITFSWWTEFDAPLPLDQTGRLADTGFEAAIADGGTLAAQVAAIAQLAEREPAPSIDVVVRPALLEQLVRMSDGYERTSGVAVEAGTGGARDAAELLRALSGAAAATSVQVSAMPFAGPSIPSLLSGGLQADLEGQRELGNEWTESAIGVDPAVGVTRPPGGLLSADALGWLAGKGARTILADADAVERPAQPNEFAVPSSATVATARGDVHLVLPDPGTQALLERADLLVDPVRAAQAVFAELAVIWREAPVPPDQPDGTPTQRGLALRLPTELPAAMWRPLVGRLAGAPFLRPVHAQQHVEQVVPPGPPAELRDPSLATFSPSYVETVRRLRQEIRALESMYTEPTALPQRIRRHVYVAEALGFLDDESAGRDWLTNADGATAIAFERVRPEVQLFTLTSREGDIPLLMGDPGPVPVRVSLELQSSGLEFPQGNRRELVLEPGPSQVVTFPVVSKSAGTHEIRVLVQAPSGQVISDQTVYVQSTALNAIALAVTASAAGLLVALWVRRWVRRRNA